MTDHKAWVEWTIANYVSIYFGELSGNFQCGDLDMMLQKIEWVLPD